MSQASAPASSQRNGISAMTRTPPPNKYLCPLTLDLMIDPVLSRWGHSYERTAIFEWLSTGNNCCPLTRKPLRPSYLISNGALKKEIEEWKQIHGYDSIPPEFICPLSNVMMTHPLISKYGDNFERSAIYAWFDAGHVFCPLTGNPLTPSGLVTNWALSQDIKSWKSGHHGSWEEMEDGMVELSDEDEAVEKFRCFPSAGLKPRKLFLLRIIRRGSVAPAAC